MIGWIPHNPCKGLRIHPIVIATGSEGWKLNLIIHHLHLRQKRRGVVNQIPIEDYKIYSFFPVDGIDQILMRQGKICVGLPPVSIRSSDKLESGCFRWLGSTVAQKRNGNQPRTECTYFLEEWTSLHGLKIQLCLQFPNGENALNKIYLNHLLLKRIGLLLRRIAEAIPFSYFS